jgi:hypothetical protein
MATPGAFPTGSTDSIPSDTMKTKTKNEKGAISDEMDDVIFHLGSGSYIFNDKKWFITLAETDDLLQLAGFQGHISKPTAVGTIRFLQDSDEFIIQNVYYDPTCIVNLISMIKLEKKGIIANPYLKRVVHVKTGIKLFRF